MKKHNFYAGPSILSEYTIKNTADAVLNFAGTGLSLMEISHRSKEFTAVIEEAKALVKELQELADAGTPVYDEANNEYMQLGEDFQVDYSAYQ